VRTSQLFFVLFFIGSFFFWQCSKKNSVPSTNALIINGESHSLTEKTDSSGSGYTMTGVATSGDYNITIHFDQKPTSGTYLFTNASVLIEIVYIGYTYEVSAASDYYFTLVVSNASAIVSFNNVSFGPYSSGTPQNDILVSASLTGPI